MEPPFFYRTGPKPHSAANHLWRAEREPRTVVGPLGEAVQNCSTGPSLFAFFRHKITAGLIFLHFFYLYIYESNMPLVDPDLEAASETEAIDFDSQSSDQNITASLHESQGTSTSESGKKRKASSFEEYSGSCCDRCNSITGELAGLRSLISTEGFKHLSLPALKQSAAAGCPSCSFLLNHFRKIPRKWNDDSVFYFRDQYYGARIKFEHRKGMDEAEFYSELHFLHERFGTLEVFFESSPVLKSRVTSLFLFADGRPYISLSL